MPLLSLRLTMSGTGIRTIDGLTLISLLDLHCGCIHTPDLKRHKKIKIMNDKHTK